MFCPKCGKKVTKDAEYCNECGATLKEETTKVEVINSSEPVNNGTPAFLWGLIGFFVPIAGLILFIVWKQDRPEDAKAAGLGALIWAILYILLIILVFAMSFIGTVMSY